MLTICIPNLNGGPFLELAVKSVRRHMPGHPIWISDHGSEDWSKEWAEANCDRFDSVAHITGDHGIPINLWSMEVQTEYFLLVDCDVEVIGNPLPEMLTLMDSDPSITAIDGSRFEVGGLPYTDNGKPFIQQARIDPSFALIRTSHARTLVSDGVLWGFKTVGCALFDVGAYTRRKAEDRGWKALRTDAMRNAHIHYGNVSWARNPSADFETLKKYVRHREIVEAKLKQDYA